MYYNELTGIPIPASAHFLDQGANVIQVTSTLHDHVRNIKRTVTKSINVNHPDLPQHWQDIGDAVGSCLSPSLVRRAILREVKDLPKPKRYVEIWCDDKIEASLDVTEAHGGFYNDGHVSSLCFSPSETSLLYVAEANVPTDSTDPYQKFRFTPQFGEGIVGKKRPTIFLYRWTHDENQTKGSRLISLSTSASALFGQAIFSPDGNTLYATGYEYTLDGRLLGVNWCYNRPSGIWQLDIPLVESSNSELVTTLNCSARKLTPSHLSCRSPRIISLEGTSILLWYASLTGGPHISGSFLYSLDISTLSSTRSPVPKIGPPLVDVVLSPRDNEFPGLYPDFNLPLLPIIRLKPTSSPYIITHSIWGSRSTVLLISTHDGKVTELTPKDDQLYSWRVHGTDGRSRVICSRSTLVSPFELVLGEFNDTGKFSWRVIDKPVVPDYIQQALSNLHVSIISIPDRHPAETIVIKDVTTPKPGSVPPCITAPHGGPHATTTTAFSAAAVALALEGYTISAPNYTGSLGFGESSIRGLIGNCGTLDVGDCIASVRHLISLGIAVEGPGKQFVMGGSHGGFLSGHLIGQFPDMFTAAVIRNPVMSAGEMTTTDIPDWYYSEFGLDYPLFSSKSTAEPQANEEQLALPPIISPEIFSKVHNASPMAHVTAVRASVLLLIGSVDLRVSPTQGTEYYHALKGRRYANENLKDSAVEMLVFEGESHPLEGVEASRVGFEAGRDFFASRKK